MTRLSSGNGWLLASVALFLLSLLLAVSYADTFMPVVGVWNQWSDGEYYAHGYLVLLMSLYMVFHERRILAARTPSPGITGVLVVAIAVLVWIVAELIHVQLLSIMALLFIIASVLLAMLGWTTFRVLFVPVFILVFALPVWSPLPPLLQVITADAVYAMARMAGLPVFQDGFLLMLPAGTLEVETSCSGLSYLLAALTLGTFYGWMFYRRLSARLLVIIVTGMAAVAANILRVFVVLIVAYRTDMQHSIIRDHFYLGWYLFGVLALALIVIDVVLVRRSGTPGDTTDFQGAGQHGNKGPIRFLAATVAVSVLLAGGPLLVKHIDRIGSGVAAVAPGLPAAEGGWAGPFPSGEKWEPVYQGAIAQKLDYHKDSSVVTLYLGYYPRQAQGSELVYYDNRIADPRAWRSQTSVNRSMEHGGLPAREHKLVSTAGQKRLVWYWYRVAGRTTTSQYMVKLFQLTGKLTGNTHSAVVAIATESNDVEAARQRLENFVSSMIHQLERITASGSD